MEIERKLKKLLLFLVCLILAGCKAILTMGVHSTINETSQGNAQIQFENPHFLER